MKLPLNENLRPEYCILGRKRRVKLEWGRNAYAETYCTSTKVGQRGGPFFGWWSSPSSSSPSPGASAKIKVLLRNEAPLFGTSSPTLPLFSYKQIRQKKCEHLKKSAPSGELPNSNSNLPRLFGPHSCSSIIFSPPYPAPAAPTPIAFSRVTEYIKLLGWNFLMG